MRKLVLLALLAIMTTSQAVTAKPISAELINVYKLVREASSLGYNTTGMVNKLDEIINETANFNEPLKVDKLKEIRESALSMLRNHFKKTLGQMLTYSAIFLLILISAYISYLLLIKKGIMWEFWLKLRGNSEIKVANRSDRNYFDKYEYKEIKVLFLIVILILFIFIIFYSIYRVEPYSGIALLGEEAKLSGYPVNVTLGQRIKLYVLVENHMDEPMLYLLKGKLDNGSLPINPSPVKPSWEHYLLLNKNSSRIVPLSLSINETGRFRLIVELWTLSDENNNFTYDSKWVHVWITVNDQDR